MNKMFLKDLNILLTALIKVKSIRLAYATRDIKRSVIMQFKKFGDKYIIRMDKGEEIVETLKKFCEDEKIKLGFIKGIGAVNKAVVGVFDTNTKQYYSTDLNGVYEITSLLGNISTMNGEVYLHLHINLSNKEYITCGGHLNSAIISATGEIMIEVIEGNVDREFNEKIGLNLYRFNE